MSLKDIEKLKEKVDKDPNSKLFVPLAEEYRKEGMLDEAIQVLLKGIERQPSYMSARVSLGKIYVEKEMLPEARSEFENVIKSIPDNLYAHKKLAEIYRDTGERDMAIRAYRVVLKLNAMDEDAQTNIADLESAGAQTAEAVKPPEPVAEKPAFSEPEVVEELPLSPAEVAQAEAPAVSDDELAAFKNSLFGEEAGGEEEAVALAEEEEIGVMEEADEGGISFGDINDVLQDKAVEAAPAPVEEAVAVVEDTVPAGAPVEEPVRPVEEPPPLPVEPEPFVPPMALSVPSAPQAEPEMPRPSSPHEAAEEADRLVAAGDFSGAISVYRRELELNPGDRKILQRVEELKTLLKLMGKDKEVLIGKLNSFLEGIAKRRDEFFGNP